MSKMPTWKRNLWVLLPGTFITSIAFCEFYPFMSLYVNQLGNFSKGQLSLYSGLVYAATSIVVMLTAPFWGHFADQHGRKWMILQTSLGSAISIALMGFVTNVWQFILLRVLQGFFGGVIPNSTALVGTEAPKEHAQYILSIYSIGYTSGMLIGPLVGGILDQYFSIRLTFLITGGLLLLFCLFSAVFVTEHFHPEKIKKTKFSWHFIRAFPNQKFIGWILATTVLVYVGVNTVYPIITLFVKQLMHNQGPIALVSGIITALPGIFDVIASPFCGRFGDHYGTGKLLLFGLLIMGLCYFPQGWAVGIWMLAVSRAINGISSAIVFPAIQTLLSKGTSVKNTGMAFSLNQGAQAMGSSIGALLGGLISNWFNYQMPFFFAGILILINYGLLNWKLPQLSNKKLVK